MAKIKNLFPVILAGGSGTRFWPLSRADNPKQFLKMTGSKTLFQEAIQRVLPCANPKNIIIVTNQRFRKMILNQTKSFKIPAANILCEPVGRNTAPAICWAAMKIQQTDPEGIMAVLPSDHVIKNRAGFLAKLKRAVSLAKKDYLVTLGIVPTRPETGYGYLQTKNKKGTTIVERFKEKPSLARAKQFIRKKNYLWNAGMFIWKTSVILEEFQRYLPRMYNALDQGIGASAINRKWKTLQNISIDYGILEKAKQVAAVPAGSIGWSDVGSWESLTEVLGGDRKGNISQGRVLSLNNQGTFVNAADKFVAAIGLEDVIVIDTDDALLVCRKDQSQKVRDVVEYLKKRDKGLI